MLINLQSVILNDGEKITINSEIEPCSTGSGEVKDIFVSGYIQNISSKLELKLDIKGNYHTLCYRCANKTIAPLMFTASDRLTQDPNDEDCILIQNNSFDITTYVHKEILLNLPFRALCKKGCKGLCDKCGIDLNKKKCNCDYEKIDSRFEKLKELLYKKEV